MRMKIKKSLALVVLFGWVVGNVFIMGTVIHIEFLRSGISLDTFLTIIVLILWVFGQFALMENVFENGKGKNVE